MPTTAGDPSDAQLLREYAQHRSETAFEALVRRHASLVHSAALRRVRDPHLADDVTQAVFLLLWQRAATFREGTIVSGWLYNAVRYVAANAMKIERRRRSHEQAAAAETAARSQRAEGDAWDQIEPHVDQAMDTLRSGDRQLILLRYFQACSVTEIGQLLGIAENTASKRLSRALDRLRDSLSKQGIAPSAAVDSAMLGSILSTCAVQPAPHATISASISLVTTGGSSAATSNAYLLAKGATKMMALPNLRVAAAIVAAVVVPASVALVTSLRTAAPTPSAQAAQATTAPFAPRHTLANDAPMSQMRFDNLPLTDVIEFLADTSGRSIYVDWTGLRAGGIDANKPISANIANAPLSQVLAEITKQISDKPDACDYSVSKGEIILISSHIGLQRLAARELRREELERQLPALSRKVPEVRLNGIPLEDAISFLADIGGIRINPDWNQLRQRGVERSAPVKVQLREVAVGEAIDLLLDSASKEDATLRMQLEGGQIRVSALARRPTPAPARGR